MQITALGIVGAIFAALLGKDGKELSVVLVLACCLVMSIGAVALMEPLVDFVVKVKLWGNIKEQYVRILLKSVAVGLVTEFGAAICDNAGQAVLGKMMRICGNVELIYIALPLLEEIMELLLEILGG